MMKKITAIIILGGFLAAQTGWAGTGFAVRAEGAGRSLHLRGPRPEEDGSAAGSVGKAFGKTLPADAAAAGAGRPEGQELSRLLTGTERDFMRLLDRAPGFSGAEVFMLRARFSSPTAANGLTKPDIQRRILQLLRLIPAGVGDIQIEALLDAAVKGGSRLYDSSITELAQQIIQERVARSADSEEVLFEGSTEQAADFIAEEYGADKAGIFSKAVAAHESITSVRIVRGSDTLRRNRIGEGIGQAGPIAVVDHAVFALLEEEQLSAVLNHIILPAEADRFTISHADPAIKEIVIVLRMMARFRMLGDSDRKTVLDGLDRVERQVRSMTGEALKPLSNLLFEFAEDEFYMRLNQVRKYAGDPFIYPVISRRLRDIPEAECIEQVKGLAVEAGGVLTDTPRQAKLNGLIRELLDAMTIDGIEGVIAHLREAASSDYTLLRPERFPASAENWILYLARHGAFQRLARFSRQGRMELIEAMQTSLPLAATYINSEAWAGDYGTLIQAMQAGPSPEQKAQLVQRKRLLDNIPLLPLLTDISLIEEIREYLTTKGIRPIVDHRDLIDGLVSRYLRELEMADSEQEVRSIFSQLLALASLGAELDGNYGMEDLDFEIPPTAKHWVMLLMLRGHTHVKGLLELNDAAQRRLVRLQFVTCPIASTIYKSGLWECLIMRQDVPLEEQDAFMVHVSEIPQIQFQMDAEELTRILLFAMGQLKDYLEAPESINPEGTVDRGAIDSLLAELAQNTEKYSNAIFDKEVSMAFHGLLETAAGAVNAASTGGDLTPAPKSRHEREFYARLLELKEQFVAAYGYEPEGYVVVPSRRVILGEHIDYLPRGYFQSSVLSFASGKYSMILAFSPREGSIVTMRSTHPDFEVKTFDIADSPKGEEWPVYLARAGVPEKHWTNYARASYVWLQNQHPDKKLMGADILVGSNIPVAAGSSSSSALVVGSGLVARLTNGFPDDPDELGLSSGKAEWFVGTRGGWMDQMTISMGEAGKALSITFDPVTVETVDMPEGYRFITFFTKHHGGGDQLTSEYNERSAIAKFVIPAALENLFNESPNLEDAWSLFQQVIEDKNVEAVESMRVGIGGLINLLPESMTLGEIESAYPLAYNQIAGEKDGAYRPLFEHKADTKLKIRDRALHHAGEVGRKLKGEKLLKEAAQAQKLGDQAACDAKMAELGKLIDETHASLRDLYEISVDEVEEVIGIIDALRDEIPGILGRRMEGGGFGGNVGVLVKEESAGTVIAEVGKRYYQAHGRDADSEGAITVSTPGQGARYVSMREVETASAGKEELDDVHRSLRLQRQTLGGAA